MSALPARTPPKREEARRLLELVPDEDLGAATRMLRGLVGGQQDPVLAAFANAPLDDEEWTPEDEAARQEGQADVAAGRVMSTEQLRCRLGL